MKIRLSGQEMITAATIGIRRHVFALVSGLSPADGAENNDDPRAFDHHIIGAMAEFAVAKSLNLFWSPNIGSIEKGDVGFKFEVRVRRLDGTGLDLVLKPKDAPEIPYILVHCRIPEFQIIGWAWGKDALNGDLKAIWNEQRRIWFVPPGQLRSMTDLVVHR